MGGNHFARKSLCTLQNNVKMVLYFHTGRQIPLENCDLHDDECNVLCMNGGGPIG